MDERTPPTIDELAGRACAGDRRAFDLLVRTQLDRLTRRVERRLGKRVRALIEVDDVVQETLLKACGGISNFVWLGEEAFFRWLARIAEHVIWKASQMRDGPRLTLELPDGEPTTALTRAARRERAARLEQALDDLSEDHRAVIRWTRIEGRSIAEAAERLGRSPNAVKKLLARALAQLRRRYGDSTGSLRIEPPPEAGEVPDGE